MVIVPAGGPGRRIQTVSLTRQKATLSLFGHTMLEYALQPVLELCGKRSAIRVVTGHFAGQVEAILAGRKPIECVCAAELAKEIAAAKGDILILPGDTVLDTGGLRNFIEQARKFPAAVLTRNFNDYIGRQRNYPLPKRKFVFVESAAGDHAPDILNSPLAGALADRPPETYNGSFHVAAGGVLYLGSGIRPRTFDPDPCALLAGLIKDGHKVACIPQQGRFCDLDDFGDFRELSLVAIGIFAQRMTATKIARGAKVDKTTVITGCVEVEAGAMIESNVRIEGPAHVGAGALLKSGSWVKCSWIGRDCRVGPNTCVRYASLGDRTVIGQGRDCAGIVTLEDVQVLGPGCFNGLVGAGATVYPNATIGDHPVDNSPVRTACGDEIMDTGLSSLGPLVGGGAVIGPNAKIMPGRQVGANAEVDAGVIVIRNVPPGTRARLAV